MIMYLCSHKLIDSYCKQVDTVLSQWEEDMIKTKEGEEKLALLMKQHHKMVQQQRVVQTQRYKTIKQLKEDFTKVRLHKTTPLIL